MAFVLQDVINETEETRSLDPLKKLKKENLVKVAAHYGITPAVGATKSHILDLIKDHCVENDIIDEVEEKPTAETAEVLKLRLEIEREERRLAREKAQRAHDAEKGKAQEIYSSLSVEQSSNYEHVKEAILKAYELVPEAYRQKFRNYLKYDSKTHVEFAREKENLFNRWCHSKEIRQDFKKLKQMVLLEEFKDKVRPDIRSHLDEQKVEELEKAAIMADDYALTHKMSSKSGNPQQKRYHGSGNRENISRNMDDRKRQRKSTENVGLVSKVESLKTISCGHCGKPGHIITNC